MIYPLPRGHPANPNAEFLDHDCTNAPLYDGCAGGRKIFPCGNYPPDKQITQTFEAGQIVNVRFASSEFGLPGQPTPLPTSDQARHSGGLCEFSLSYDQGKTFGVFARYHKSCPDLLYEWPVKLPDNLPSCDNCIFAWSWTGAVGAVPEYYMSCADIKITGKVPQGGLPPEVASTSLRLANMPGYPYDYYPGDGFGNMKGTGPSPEELDANMRGATGGPDPNSPPLQRRRRSLDSKNRGVDRRDGRRAI
ncbi:hypothetical protein BX616_002414 [Lobosporangium transversale]|nr:hypothetical protein BX616_002414 [Lobosporangium transversale]